MPRKSPIRHKVRQHRREDYPVESYSRGSGKSKTQNVTSYSALKYETKSKYPSLDKLRDHWQKHNKTHKFTKKSLVAQNDEKGLAILEVLALDSKGNKRASTFDVMNFNGEEWENLYTGLSNEESQKEYKRLLKVFPVRISKPKEEKKEEKKKKPITYEQAELMHQMRSERSQSIDESKIAKNKIPKIVASSKYNIWMVKPNRVDIEGIDSPLSITDARTNRKQWRKKLSSARPSPLTLSDLKKMKTKTHKKGEPAVELIGDPKLIKRFQPIVDERFEDLKNLPLLTRKVPIKRGRKRRYGGYFQYRLSKDWNTKKTTLQIVGVHVNMGGLYDEKEKDDIFIHEFTHFRRLVDKKTKLNRVLLDGDREEKETSHETNARAGEDLIKKVGFRGYYQYVKGRFPDVRLKDLRTIQLYSKTGKTNTRNIEENIVKNQNRTFLNKVKVASSRLNQKAGFNPEDVDVYLQTTEGDMYHFYNPSGKLRSIKNLSVFVDEADHIKGEEDVYEWRDGKPHLILRGKRK